jgi:hypothetical protein
MQTRSPLSLLLILMLFGSVAEAGRVLQVAKNPSILAVSHNVDRNWEVGDKVCIYHRNTAVGCGVVRKVMNKGAVVKLVRVRGTVQRGDDVRVSNDRTTASDGDLADSVGVGGNRKYSLFELTAGTGFGTNYLYPLLNFQVAVWKYLSVGIQPFYVTSSGTSSGTTVNASIVAGMLTGNLYPLKQVYEGLWIQAGLGLVSYSLSGSPAGGETASGLVGIGTAGWRFKFGAFNLGAAAGVLYLSTPTLSLYSLSVSTSPLAMLDVGFNF